MFPPEMECMIARYMSVDTLLAWGNDSAWRKALVCDVVHQRTSSLLTRFFLEPDEFGDIMRNHGIVISGTF